MKIDIVTLFPKMFSGPFDESIINRAKDRGLVEINIHYLRDWAEGRHQVVDDRPYGGGVGMLLMVEPLYKAITELKKDSPEAKVILLDAGGEIFTQGKARDLSKEKHIIFICGRYEGVDHRVREHLIDMEISIGNYVLTGGELPTMVVLDSVVRLIPGVLEKEDATALESHSEEGIVEYPQYTRPEDFNGWKVPEVLLSGNHKNIEDWKKEESMKRSGKI
jgi:tRNA (guanine37-N1)-methyltransferase